MYSKMLILHKIYSSRLDIFVGVNPSAFKNLHPQKCLGYAKANTKLYWHNEEVLEHLTFRIILLILPSLFLLLDILHTKIKSTWNFKFWMHYEDEWTVLKFESISYSSRICIVTSINLKYIWHLSNAHVVDK